MRILIITISLICSFQFANAQQIKLQELLSFIRMDVSDVNDLLIQKKWSFINNIQKDQHTITSFAYQYNNVDSTAPAWLGLVARKGYASSIIFQTTRATYYSNIVTEIKQTGAAKIGSSANENDKITTTYSGKTYRYEINSSTNSYTIKIYDKVSDRKELLDDILNSPQDSTKKIENY